MADTKDISKPGDLKKTIFISDISPTMKIYRDNLVKELEHQGCTVLVSKSDDQGFYEGNDIPEQCDIAVHILSDNENVIGSSGHGIESIQIRNSVGFYQRRKILSGTSQNGFMIYAWHPKSGSESIYEEEKVPDHLKKIQQMEEVELLRTNFEDFKFYLLKKLNSTIAEVSDEFYIKGSDNISVYFIYDKVDKKAAKEYIDYFNKRGFTVMSPDFDADILTFRQHHAACLKKFDIAVVFALEAGLNWINMKIMDILKSPGLGREKPILGKGVFTDKNKGLMLQLKNRGFEFCDIGQNFNKQPFEDFLNKITH
jgi:hypothetical protein